MKNSVRRVNIKEQIAKECTFQPDISRSNKGSKERKRSVKKFLDDQSAYERDKQIKLRERREEIDRVEKSELTYRPIIDRKSHRIASQMKDSEAIDRLSKGKRKNWDPIEETLFSPKILTRSKQLSRRENVSNLLYHDAQRRQEREKFMRE